MNKENSAQADLIGGKPAARRRKYRGEKKEGGESQKKGNVRESGVI